MPLNVYLNFAGNAREAVHYYAKVFNAPEPQIMAFGDAPPSPEYQLPEEAKNLVMHAMLMVSGSPLMFSDTFPGAPFTVGNNVNVTLSSKNVDEIRSAFENLSKEGTVVMPLQETFWSPAYGQLVDKFGIHWQLSAEQEHG